MQTKKSRCTNPGGIFGTLVGLGLDFLFENPTKVPEMHPGKLTFCKIVMLGILPGIYQFKPIANPNHFLNL